MKKKTDGIKLTVGERRGEEFVCNILDHTYSCNEMVFVSNQSFDYCDRWMCNVCGIGNLSFGEVCYDSIKNYKVCKNCISKLIETIDFEEIRKNIGEKSK